ncbi:MAG: peptidoglycan bridge formation glycyltransferase FemA/FemB family protein [Candidatus Falkowbacteria bacterium]
MKILPLLNTKVVQDFLVKAAPNSGAEFLASLEWAEILKTEGAKVETLGVYNDNQELVAVFNLIYQRLSVVYSPRGPVFNRGLSQGEQVEILQFLITYLRNKKIIFWRVEPREILPPGLSFKKVKNLQPQKTLMLNLEVSETELLNSFHPKTRYNIKLADKKGVVIREGVNATDFEDFWSLMGETGRRDAFKIHNKNHYLKLATAKPEFIKLLLAQVNHQTVAAGLFAFYGNKVTYLHGASSYQNRQLMAPYLLQWTLIKMARASHYKYYDFYGVDGLKWPGVTRFKLGFSGFSVSYAGTYDLILNPIKYYLYNLLKKVKRFL